MNDMMRTKQVLLVIHTEKETDIMGSQRKPQRPAHVAGSGPERPVAVMDSSRLWRQNRYI